MLLAKLAVAIAVALLGITAGVSFVVAAAVFLVLAIGFATLIVRFAALVLRFAALLRFATILRFATLILRFATLVFRLATLILGVAPLLVLAVPRLSFTLLTLMGFALLTGPGLVFLPRAGFTLTVLRIPLLPRLRLALLTRLCLTLFSRLRFARLGVAALLFLPRLGFAVLPLRLLAGLALAGFTLALGLPFAGGTVARGALLRLTPLRFTLLRLPLLRLALLCVTLRRIALRGFALHRVTLGRVPLGRFMLCRKLRGVADLRLADGFFGCRDPRGVLLSLLIALKLLALLTFTLRALIARPLLALRIPLRHPPARILFRAAPRIARFAAAVNLDLPLMLVIDHAPTRGQRRLALTLFDLTPRVLGVGVLDRLPQRAGGMLVIVARELQQIVQPANLMILPRRLARVVIDLPAERCEVAVECIQPPLLVDDERLQPRDLVLGGDAIGFGGVDFIGARSRIGGGGARDVHEPRELFIVAQVTIELRNQRLALLLRRRQTLFRLRHPRIAGEKILLELRERHLGRHPRLARRRQLLCNVRHAIALERNRLLGFLCFIEQIGVHLRPAQPIQRCFDLGIERLLRRLQLCAHRLERGTGFEGGAGVLAVLLDVGGGVVGADLRLLERRPAIRGPLDGIARRVGGGVDPRLRIRRQRRRRIRVPGRRVVRVQRMVASRDCGIESAAGGIDVVLNLVDAVLGGIESPFGLIGIGARISGCKGSQEKGADQEGCAALHTRLGVGLAW